jgi:hypothetical protein
MLMVVSILAEDMAKICFIRERGRKMQNPIDDAIRILVALEVQITEDSSEIFLTDGTVNDIKRIVNMKLKDCLTEIYKAIDCLTKIR